MNPTDMSAVIGRKRYDTSTATLLADDAYWDGHNFERGGRNNFLYRTPRGAYFVQRLTLWEKERDRLEPVSEEEAVDLYESPLTEHHVSYEEAFPTITVEDA